MDAKQPGVRTAATTVCSALAFVFVYGPRPYWPFAWIAPIPVLVLAFDAPWRRAMWVAFAAYACGGLGWAYVAALAAPLSTIAVCVLIASFVFSGAVLAARRAVQRLPPWAAVFAYPLFWTAWEFFLGRQGIAGISYSQLDMLPVAQIAALVGTSGITFIVSLVASALAMAWRVRRGRAAVLQALALPLVLTAAAIAWGAHRVERAPAAGTVRVGLAATDMTVGFFRTERAEEALFVVTSYARRVGELAARGAEVVVLPEKFVGVTPADAAAVHDVLAAAARTHHVWVIAGLNRIEGTARRNVAMAFAPDGTLALEYGKVHLVPGWEDAYTPGNLSGIVPLHTDWAVAICRDLNYTDIARADSLADVRLLLVPGWDFVRDAWLASRIAIMRGVEHGIAIARSAQEGRVIISDAYGRILADAVSGASPETLVVADVPLGLGSTPYARAGDWFGWLTVLLSVVMIGMILIIPARQIS